MKVYTQLGNYDDTKKLNQSYEISPHRIPKQAIRNVPANSAIKITAARIKEYFY